MAPRCRSRLRNGSKGRSIRCRPGLPLTQRRIESSRTAMTQASTTAHRSDTLTAAGLAVLLIAAFMAQFDFFVVNVAGPAIRRSLGASDAGIAIVVGGYAFGYAAALVLGGRLG